MSGDEKIPLGGDDEDKEHRLTIGGPHFKKLNAFGKLHGGNAKNALDKILEMLPEEPEGIQSVFDLMNQAQTVDAQSSPQGGAANDMKEVALARMWAKVASGGDDEKLSMRDILLLKMLQEKPERPSFFEQMMMLKEMKSDDPNTRSAAEQAWRERENEYKQQIAQREQSFKDMVAELKGEIREKKREDEFNQFRQEQDYKMQELVGAISEKFQATVENINTRMGYAGHSPDPARSKKEVLMETLTEVDEIVKAVNKIAPTYGLTPQQTGQAIQQAAEKTGLRGYVDDITNLMKTAGDLAGKIQTIGSPAEVPAPDGRFAEAADILRPVHDVDLSGIQLRPAVKKAAEAVAEAAK